MFASDRSGTLLETELAYPGIPLQNTARGSVPPALGGGYLPLWFRERLYILLDFNH